MISKGNHTCYLPVEVKVREFDAKVYLAWRLVQRGYSCVVGPKAGVRSALLSSDSCPIYFDKGFYKYNYAFYQTIRARKGFLVGLDEEATFVPSGESGERLIQARHHPAILRFISAIFAWGRYQKSIIKELFDEDRVFLTGHPKFDLMHPSMHAFGRALGNSYMKDLDGFVLINTNFAHYNSYLDFETFINRYKLCDGRERLLLYREHNERVFYYFLDFLERAAAENPDLKFVVRPHPTERLDTYHDRLGKYKNIIISNDGAAYLWILRSKCVIHHDCSTAVEAYLSGIKVYAYLRGMDPLIAQKIPLLVSTHVETEDELMEAIRSGIHTPGDSEKKIRAEVGEYLSNIDGNSAQEVCNLVDQLVSKDPQERETPGLADSLAGIPWRLGDLSVRLRSRFKRATGGKERRQNWDELASSKLSSITEAEVKERLKLLATMEGGQVPQIEAISENTFSIRP